MGGRGPVSTAAERGEDPLLAAAGAFRIAHAS